MGVIVHDFNGSSDITVDISTHNHDSVNYVLKFEGIEGENQANEIELESWSWGESNTTESAGSGGAGKAKMQDFQFTMRINRASPQLLLACAAGKHLRKATLSGRKADKTPQDFLRMTFSDVVIDSFQTSVTSSSNPFPVDRISIRYAAIEYEYMTQKTDGSPDIVRVGWNLKENRPI